jgi:hypothetical protein
VNHETPRPLPEGTTIDKFVPDPPLNWCVAYAGPCNDPECQEPHRQLFLVPMIGWLQVLMFEDADDNVRSFVLRPAVMTMNGRVSDYLDVDIEYDLIGVFRNEGNVEEKAIAIFKARFGDAPIEVMQRAAPASN